MQPAALTCCTKLYIQPQKGDGEGCTHSPKRVMVTRLYMQLTSCRCSLVHPLDRTRHNQLAQLNTAPCSVLHKRCRQAACHLPACLLAMRRGFISWCGVVHAARSAQPGRVQGLIDKAVLGITAIRSEGVAESKQ